MTGWTFDTDSPWVAMVPAAPNFETCRQYFEVAVPAIAAQQLGRARTPAAVVARVTARPAPGRMLPGGPRDRAKGLMDALHDDRTNGPKYASLGATAPLPGDDPAHVRALAVEVRAGTTDAVEYRIGNQLLIAGELLHATDVCVPAPNDIDDTARLVAQRKAFVEDLVRRCDHGEAKSCVGRARALVVRHRPQRDEDNTWATWISALTGGGAWSRALWPSPGSPFSGWSPMAVASIADANLPCQVRYEIYA